MMDKRRSLSRVCERLVDGAIQQCYLGDGHMTQSLIKQYGYDSISERKKPGRMIMAMDPEDRKFLKEAREKDFNGRFI